VRSRQAPGPEATTRGASKNGSAERLESPCGHRPSGACALVKGNNCGGFLHTTVYKNKISVAYCIHSIVPVQARAVLVF